MRLINRLKQSRFLVLDTRGGDVGVQKFLRLAVKPDQLFLVALFQQPEPGALSFVTVIAALYADNGADAPKSVTP